MHGLGMEACMAPPVHKPKLNFNQENCIAFWVCFCPGFQIFRMPEETFNVQLCAYVEVDVHMWCVLCCWICYFLLLIFVVYVENCNLAIRCEQWNVLNSYGNGFSYFASVEISIFIMRQWYPTTFSRRYMYQRISDSAKIQENSDWQMGKRCI